jgi:hypothetical protein
LHDADLYTPPSGILCGDEINAVFCLLSVRSLLESGPGMLDKHSIETAGG